MRWNSCSALDHCRPFSHALSAELQATTSSSMKRAPCSRRTFRAEDHCWLLAQALTAALRPTTPAPRPPAPLGTSSSAREASHRPLLAHAAMEAPHWAALGSIPVCGASAKSRRACDHCPPFSQALAAVPKAAASGSRPSQSSPWSSSAEVHASPLPQAVAAAVRAARLGRSPRQRESSNSRSAGAQPPTAAAPAASAAARDTSFGSQARARMASRWRRAVAQVGDAEIAGVYATALGVSAHLRISASSPRQASQRRPLARAPNPAEAVTTLGSRPRAGSQEASSWSERRHWDPLDRPLASTQHRTTSLCPSSAAATLGAAAPGRRGIAPQRRGLSV